MILNAEYQFRDVRYLISAKTGELMPVRKPDGTRTFPAQPKLQQISYDVELCFIGEPRKQLLPPGTSLFRLEYPISFALFMSVWWMRKPILDALFQKAGDAAELRREWQHSMAMSGQNKGVRTRIVEIQLTAEVYAWVGVASPLNHKRGGAEQIFLPNLARGAGPNQSDYARVVRTYTLPAV